MITWVLFVWYFGGAPLASGNYDTAAECERTGAMYRRSACVQVVVPEPQHRASMSGDPCLVNPKLPQCRTVK